MPLWTDSERDLAAENLSFGNVQVYHLCDASRFFLLFFSFLFHIRPIVVFPRLSSATSSPSDAIGHAIVNKNEVPPAVDRYNNKHVPRHPYTYLLYGR